ncbi:DEAD/DEAH box helicase family protein [Aedoeadaptatus coli]|uniref:DEAD/DEAH box helicase family protein n=1 Tax=Aedoeadaptatus coli TaxID=2058292 RepID=UPI000D55C453|nr:DEAD/DEAH box helicase family protein [Peptoniphilus coli]
MAGNFDFLLSQSDYSDFARAAVDAERSMLISTVNCAAATRRALELAVKWVYKVDRDLSIPYRDNLSTLTRHVDFLNIIDADLEPLIVYVIKLGNLATHTGKIISKTKAVVALRNLFAFIQWIDYCYGARYEARIFDENLIPSADQVVLKGKGQPIPEEDDVPLVEQREATDDAMQARLTKKRAAAEAKGAFRVDHVSEAQTRKELIDVDLALAGWVVGKNAEAEVEVSGMPNSTGKGYVDYVLYGTNGQPLAVVEAKKTAKSPGDGRHQARLYAECMEARYGRRPFYFTTNGFEIRFTDDGAERRVSGFYSRRDLERLMNRRGLSRSLTVDQPKASIAGRPYQIMAVKAVMERFEANYPAALLVMATGTGKTRTAASIVDMMMGANRATRILFLADRVALVKQAMRTFGQLLPDLSIASVGEGKTRPEELATARMLFSTYPAMINAMDRMRLEGKERFFTVGYFDLIIIDEAHRSIYERYKTIFDYFDAKIVGLTATPREDLDRNTYDIFGLEVGDPTFYYEMGEAVKNGYLVDYRTREVKLKFPEEGIHYDQLSPEEQARFEKLFAVEAGEDTVPGSAINKWFFNVNTVDIVINELMERGVRDGTGNEIGKTIIFAANQRHAELIKERFDVLYPEKGSDYADVITHAVQYAQDLIDRFSVKEKMPRIAISVNMLDTGIDVPEVVNLVFFKKVLSKTMFWQMVGRGTRLCPDLFGPGEDKVSFLILDYGGNMERFSVPSKPSTETITRSLTERIYMAKAHLIYALEAGPFKGEEYSRWRVALADEWKTAIGKLNTELVAVREQLNYVYYFGNEAAWKGMSRGDLNTLEDRLAPLIHAITDDEKIQRFDLAMYTLAGARAMGESDERSMEKVRAWALALLEKQRDLPAIEARAFELNQLASEDFWVHATPLMIEEMRAELRHLMSLLPARPATRSKFGDFTDDVLTVNEGGSISNVGQFENYRARVEEHIRSRVKDDAVLNKVYNNDPLSVEDMAHLESILWHDLGTKKEYDDTFGEKAILKLIREINGLSPEAVQRAFADFLNRYELSFDQGQFVRMIMEYFEHNGYLSLMGFSEEPFKSLGSITRLFKDEREKLNSIVDIVKALNGNVA